MSSLVPSHLRDMNRLSVYQIVCQQGETSKAELSRLSGISKPTVLRIVSFLVENGLLLEAGEKESALGRKPQVLRLNKNRFLAIGVLHEGDSVKIGLVNLCGEIVLERKISGRGRLQSIICEQMVCAIDEMCQEYAVAPHVLTGIGIGLPAVYDIDRKRIVTAPLLGIDKPTCIAPMLAWLEKKYGCPVIVDNDLNMEVQGEFYTLGLDEKEDLIYLSLGTGLGSGIILNGNLRRGNDFMCGEIGYMAFVKEGLTNHQETGWLEHQVNIQSLQSRFDILSGDKGTIEQASGYVMDYLLLCINNIAACLDCRNISLGGEVIKMLGDRFVDALRERVNRMRANPINIQMKQSEEPGIIGAGNVMNNLAIRRLLFEENDKMT